MKAFSLFSPEKEIHIAPGQIHLSAKEMATLLSAKELLDQVQTDADAYRAQTVAECEKERILARQAGFQEALISLNQHILLLDKQLDTLRREVHEKILPLALRAARKIVGEELKLHPDRILDIVLSSLKPVIQHKKIALYVSRSDLETLEKSKSQIKSLFEKLESFTLQERSDIEPGGCIIETEAGIINAQLENQWRALETAFETFMKR
jgi:type III secretion protein L